MGKLTATEKSTHVDIESENNQESNSDGHQSKQELIEWRYNKEMELASKGVNQATIADILKLDKSTISKDFKKMRKQAREGIREYIEEVLPFEHKKAIVSFDEVISRAWLTVSQNQHDPRITLQALGIISDAVMKRQQVLGDPQYIQQAITTVAKLKKQTREMEDEEQEIQSP